MRAFLLGIVTALAVAPVSHAQMGDVREAERRAEVARLKALQRDVKGRVTTVKAKVSEVERTRAAIARVNKELAGLQGVVNNERISGIPTGPWTAVAYVLKHALSPVLTSNPQNPSQDMRSLEVLDRYAKQAQLEAEAENRRLAVIFREREAEKKKAQQLYKRHM